MGGGEERCSGERWGGERKGVVEREGVGGEGGMEEERCSGERGGWKRKGVVERERGVEEERCSGERPGGGKNGGGGERNREKEE